MPRGYPGTGTPRGPTQASLLQVIIDEMKTNNEKLGEVHTGVDKILVKADNPILSSLGDILQSAKELYEFFTGNDLQEAEDRRELLDTLKALKDGSKGGGPGIPGDPTKSSKFPKQVSDGEKMDWGSKLLWALGLGGGFGLIGVGFVSGFTKEILRFVKVLGKELIGPKALGRITAGWERIITLVGKDSSIGKFFSTIGGMFSRVKEGFSRIVPFASRVAKWVKEIGSGPERSLMGDLRDIGRMLTKGIKTILKPLKGLGSFFSRIFVAGALDNVMGMFVKVPNILKSFFKLGEAIGKLAGKVAIPVTIALALWDTISEAFKGYKEDGWGGALRGAAIGLTNSLVGWIVDLVKDGLSWISTKLGFDRVAEWLDSWDFKSVFTTAFDWLTDQIAGIAELIMDPEKGKEFLVELGDSIWVLMKDAWKKICSFLNEQVDQAADQVLKSVDFGTDFVKEVLRAVLPSWDNNSPLGPMSPNNLAVSALKTAGVYEFAGKDPDSGKVIGSATNAGAILQAGTQALIDTASAAGQKGATVINNYGGNTTNNSSAMSAFTAATMSPMNAGMSLARMAGFGFGQ